MDYEKKYKEALERAKNLHKDAIDMGENIRAKQCEIIFPELKEDEDERIRKELITHCRNTRCVTEEGAERIAKWIAWLEKQGEPLSVDVDVESMVQSYKKRLANECNISAESLLVTICLTSFRHGIENTIDDLKLKYLKTRQD